MGKIPPSVRAEELVFATSDKGGSRRISQLLRKGYLRKIAPGIYTSNLADTPAAIIRRNWFRILASRYSDALLSHRSALEFSPTPTGHIYLTYTYTQNVRLPGLTIHLLKGAGKMEGDDPFFEKLCVSQEARALLENLQESRKNGEESKTLSRRELEDRLETIIRARGEGALNRIRDTARALSVPLRMDREFGKLSKIISALLTTGSPVTLKSPASIARSLGEPVDPDRLRLFETLYETLARQVFRQLVEPIVSDPHYRTLAFFEAYFSNYIEGTEFTVDEAREIIRTQAPLPARYEDSQDILGTYRIVSNKQEMAICPWSPDHFLEILRTRHSRLLASRTSQRPGEFKDKNNRAGNTVFVDHKLANGTLKKGFEWYALLKDPFSKAAYMMFLVTEVHPFIDGNGRIARVMMNAELSSRGHSKIIIPTVYRDDYLGALRKASRQRSYDSYIKMLWRAHDFTHALTDSTLESMEERLTQYGAFSDPGDGRLSIPPLPKIR